jgi:small conductance mechanosensitive channel
MNNEEATQILRSLEEIDFGTIVLIIGVAWAIVTLLQNFLPWLSSQLPSRFRFYILPLTPILRLVVLIFALVQLIPKVINPSLQNIVAVVTTASVAIGFAFKDYISSIIAGIVVLYERPYRTGDWVEIGGDYGEIRSMGLRAIQINTPDDNIVTIPHAKIWNNNISNANNGSRQHMCVAHFYLHPEHDAGRVRRKLWEVGITSAYTDLKRPLTVIVQEKPWGVHYQLKAYPFDGRQEFQFISDLTVRGKEALATLGAKATLATIMPISAPSTEEPEADIFDG